MSDRKNWLAEAQSDAWETMDNFVDEMVKQWRTSGEVSNDLHNDYSNGDSYHHESHVDKDYRLTEASELLDQLSEYEETDNGLWQGLEPRRAIAAQAAYTYGNAVYDMWRTLVDDINAELGELTHSMGSDATDKEIKAAGERLIRFYVLRQNDYKKDDFDGLVLAALQGVRAGDRTAALVLADKVQERANEVPERERYKLEAFAKGLRAAMEAEPEADDDSDDEAA
jgi:hypothetical protein